MEAKKRYVQVGLGSRSYLYHEAMLGKYQDANVVVGVCDVNEGRVRLRQSWASAKGSQVAGYLEHEFDQMIEECQPDIVIVTTMDRYHDEYICRAMELGCDVITEKPMTIDAQKCQRILDTQKRTGKVCRVTFNYRYSPPRTQVKDLLMSGVIGQVLSADFHWLLDTTHGADYFRRWHRNKENSGGLLVHKATHHFDLVNWWLSSIPVTVYATGQREFYTPRQAEVYQLTRRAERCLDCPESTRCKFHLDMRQHEELRLLYLENELFDGYYRDRCVFSDQIDIEDSIGAVVEYANGVKLTYSLNAFMPWEGYIITFNGSQGRLEHRCEETVYISGDGSVPGALKSTGTTIHIYPHFSPAYGVDIWQAEGGHGGGDRIMLEDLLNPAPPYDPYLRAADQRAGAYSILTGIAANQSIASHQPVQISKLVSGLEMPDYPSMPGRYTC